MGSRRIRKSDREQEKNKEEGKVRAGSDEIERREGKKNMADEKIIGENRREKRECNIRKEKEDETK